jgi:RNA polymerase sigma-70 factor (ECF subfamily)
MNTQTRVMKGATSLAKDTDWEAAYREYLPRVYNFLLYRIGDVSLVEDLTSAVFEKAWRGRNRYRRDLGAFSTWLFTIARNAATDHFRRNGREVPLESIHGQADTSSLDETVQRRDDFAQLNLLLSRLPARERELVALKYGAGLNNREIARLTRLSESNVGTILNRVIEKLRIEMEVNHER